MNRSQAWWWLSLGALVGLVLSACAPAARMGGVKRDGAAELQRGSGLPGVSVDPCGDGSPAVRDDAV